MPTTHMRIRSYDLERLRRFAQRPTGNRRVMTLLEFLSFMFDKFEEAENGRDTRRAKMGRRKREKKLCATRKLKTAVVPASSR